MRHLLYDGHGSTRQLVDNNEDVTDAFSYDGYGAMPGANPANAATSLLYTGEMYDSSASMYYLRARWYDQQTGRFNRMDPFAGNNQDPQSLHKYLYCHANPVNSSDPSGRLALLSVLASIVVRTVQAIIRLAPIVTAFFVVVKILTEGPAQDPELVLAIEIMRQAIRDHHCDIVNYGYDHNITSVMETDDIPPFPVVRESYRYGLIPHMLDFGYFLTNPITHTICVNRRWLKNENPDAGYLVFYLCHEYGHILYGRYYWSESNEAAANDFQQFLGELIQDDNVL